ncbi:pyocin knob domain-containing protein [Cereibacter azotoformans]|uniref:pyocin knob domain-containing protein n=1 Tax=Cereibacter azotoformans TaxID=43057 RepID=UPI003B2270C4
MATLPELPEWVAGIYQIETTDPVLGGTPNEETGAGKTNIPALQLAKRTAFLKSIIDDAGMGGAAAASVTNFDTITKAGWYFGPAGTTGAPDAGTYTLQHLPGNSVSNAAQIAWRAGSAKPFARRKASGTWGGWVQMASMDDLSAGFATSKSSNGYIKLPNSLGGLIIQWGEGVTSVEGAADNTFPIAFPNACLSLTAADLNGATNAAGAHIITVELLTKNSFKAASYTYGGARWSSPFNYIAIGH